MADESLRPRILCIEDDHETAQLLVEDLSERGYEVALAEHGQSGLSAILRSPPDLVLCDVNMPIMSGFDLLDLLTAMEPRFGHIPFVFLTALGDRESELRGRRLGADDYLTKPIDFEILSTIISARLTSVARNEVWPKKISLNDREIETLTWAARGKTSAEIARILGLARRTVDFHIDNARNKLGTATRIEAAYKAVAGHLITP